MLLGTVYYEIQSIAVIFWVVSLQFFLYSLLHKLMEHVPCFNSLWEAHIVQ